MDLKQLALALGLDENAPQDQVFAKMALVVKEGTEAKTSLAAVREGLAAHGLALSEDGKVVKPEQLATEPREGDDPEKAELRRQVAANALETAKMRLSAARKETEDLVKSLQVPPSMAQELERLLSASAPAESLALSQDGGAVIKMAFDVAGSVRKLLGAIPKPMAKTVQQLAADKEDEAKREALSTKAKNLAAKAQGRKVEKKG
jgi:hypothetical protein